MVRKIIGNQSGALTIVFLVMLSALFIVMMGIAGLKLMTTAKQAARMSEAYNYLVVMEEIGQAINRYRTLGLRFDCSGTACPAGTVLRTVNAGAGVQVTACGGGFADTTTYSLCVPNSDGDGVAEASDFCAVVSGQNYCLTSTGGAWQGLNRLDTTDEGPPVNQPFNRPANYGPPPATAMVQQSAAAAAVRATEDLWTPATIPWGAPNEILTTDCGAYPGGRTRYWLGCDYCADPNVECWQMSMCKPGTPCAATERVHQGIMIYFENNKP